MRKLLLPTILLLFVATASEAQITSIVDGAWSDTITWSAGRVPITSDAVTIATTVTVDDDLVFQALTVLAGGTLAGVAGENKVLRVNGNVLNQGSITQSGTGNDFRLFVAGDIQNEGTLNVRLLWFTGATDQNLSQTEDARWLSTVYNNKTGGRLVATTDLDFAGSFALNAGRFRTLVMNGHDLIVSGSGTISYVTVVSPERLVGRTNSTAFARNTTFTGPVTVVETVRLSSDVVFDSLVTVTGTLTREVSSNNTSTVRFNQDLVNLGTIEDEHPDRGKLRLRVYGNIRNEGTWAASKTEFRGELDQTLYLASGKMWAGGFDWEKESGAVIALTDQVFGGSTRIDSLYMDGYDLAVSGTGQFTNRSKIYTPGTIQSIDGNEEFATGTQIIGDTVIQDWLSPGYQMTIDGNLLVEGTLESARGGDSGVYTAMTIEGDLTNRGTITNGTNGATLSLRVGGDVLNQGSWTTEALELINAGSRTVWVPAIDSDVYCGQRFSFRKEGSLLLDGDSSMPDLSVTGERPCAVLYGATLSLTDPPSSSLQNFGTVKVTRSSAAGLNNMEFYQARITVETGVTNSVSVTHFGNQVPNTFSNAVSGWWRLASESSPANLTEVYFLYDGAGLSDADENALEVYNSTDGGNTWKQISTQSNLTRDSFSNRVRLVAPPADGDYVLSALGPPTTGSGKIVADVIGRSTIRVGAAPNQFTILYANHGDTESGIIAIVVKASKYTHITEVRPSNLPASSPGLTNSDEYGPVFGVEDALQPDSVAILLADRLAPSEARYFDIILTADREIEAITDPMVSVTIMSSAVDEPDMTSLLVGDRDIAEQEWALLGQQYPYNERPLTPFFDAVLARIESAGKTADAASVFVGRYTNLVATVGAILGCVGVKIIRQRQMQIESAYDRIKGRRPGMKAKKSASVIEANKSNSRFDRVVKWGCKKLGFSVDPNEKVGPAGDGSQGFVSSFGRMTYQIFFENKAEATAPAYQVFIDDTLSAEFDPSTVIFERESHPGFETSVSGRVLHWEVTGIELPPNVNPPEGEGYVQFSVEPVAGLQSGTILSNRAIIVFDVNDPIVTDTYVNTLDLGSPVTSLEPLESQLPADSIAVRWQAIDGVDESGVQSTTVFASRDGGRFEAVGVSYGDSLLVAVEPGHEYSFYALSKDAVGNVEQQRPALVTTHVVSGVATEDEALPFVFSLDPNYPNPFNPVTTIRFSLPEHGQTRLNVYDVTGRLVAKLVDGMLPAGPQYIAWDARNMASGVYFYRLIQGNQIQTRPMVLLR